MSTLETPRVADDETPKAEPAKLGETPFHPEPPPPAPPPSWPEEFGVPLYKSHKRVRAAKLVEIIQGLGLRLEGVAQVWIPGTDYLTKHKPEVGGYVVFYEDGYASWSPAQPFEEGYTLAEVTDARFAFATRNTDAERRFANGVSLPPADSALGKSSYGEPMVPDAPEPDEDVKRRGKTLADKADKKHSK